MLRHPEPGSTVSYTLQNAKSRIELRERLRGVYANRLQRGRVLRISRHDHRNNRLPVHLVKITHNSHVQNTGVTRDSILHLGGIDVLPTGDDHVLHPVDQRHESVRSTFYLVTSVQPAIPDSLRGLFRLVPVTLHHRFGLKDHFADLTFGNIIALRVDNSVHTIQVSAQLELPLLDQQVHQLLLAALNDLGSPHWFRQYLGRQSEHGHAFTRGEVLVLLHVEIEVLRP